MRGSISPGRSGARHWHGIFAIIGMKKLKTSNSGPQYAGTPPVQHSEVVLAQQDKDREVAELKQSIKAINEDDIEADKHNGSGGAFEATEQGRDDSEE